MNFLAHQYLSGSDEQIKIGNFIADMIRGREIEQFDSRVQEGVLLHRAIDSFTDHHSAVKEAVNIFRTTQGKYAPVIVDITFDHFLAANWKDYHEQDLNDFAHTFYDLLLKNITVLPEKVQWMVPRMKKQNWLYGYQFLDGIQQAYLGVSRRASFDSNMANARHGLEQNYDELKVLFEIFFRDIVTFVRTQNVEI